MFFIYNCLVITFFNSFTYFREAEKRRRTRRQAVRRRPPVRQLRIRREYRLLSDLERRLFHRAINMLKADRVCTILMI
jgi:hypothetical protein